MLSADRELTSAVAHRLRAAAGDRVRRVIVFGSRALGTATPDSDVDVLLLLEIPTGACWTPRDNVAERHRLLAAMAGVQTPTIELWVRTTDQFEEARSVPGAVEHAAAVQGVAVYDSPSTRRPVVRRSREVVRAHNVADWARGALQLLERADGERDAGRAAELAARAIRWGCTALLVLNDRAPPDKREPLHLLRARLARFEPLVARRLDHASAVGSDPIATARVALREITARLRADPRLAPPRGSRTGLPGGTRARD